MFFTTGKQDKTAYTEELIDNVALQMKRRSFHFDDKKSVILAGFDIDGTLVVTKSGAVFARGGHDWKLLPGASNSKRIMQDLREMYPSHQCVCVLFTNQGGTVPRQNSKSYINLTTKLNGIIKALDCVDLVYAALKNPNGSTSSKYRKPNTGMMDSVTKLSPASIDKEKSFYVGDAAGRAQDHSKDDLNFAKNAGIPFFTPETYFKETSDLDRSQEDKAKENSVKMKDEKRRRDNQEDNEETKEGEEATTSSPSSNAVSKHRERDVPDSVDRDERTELVHRAKRQKESIPE